MEHIGRNLRNLFTLKDKFEFVWNQYVVTIRLDQVSLVAVD
jgi:hypothetical protein